MNNSLRRVPALLLLLLLCGCGRGGMATATDETIASSSVINDMRLIDIDLPKTQP